MKKIIFLIVGARPNFVKIAPLWKECRKHPIFSPYIIHTGQHYDYEMSKLFFKEFSLPEPHFSLNTGSETHSVQIAKIMMGFEKIVHKKRPDLIIVVGDVNSTLACGLVAAKEQIPLAHIEAGLRSFDKSMPEEINRIVIDHLSDYLFTSCKDGEYNLLKEGIPEGKIFFVGNIMIDTLKIFINKAKGLKTFKKLGLKKNEYLLLTLHRPSNVDTLKSLKKILSILKELNKKIEIVFPAHPRTQRNFEKFGLFPKIKNLQNLTILKPLGYLEFLNLMYFAKFVMTDSGGIQEETSYLGVPCLTIRNNTERPITIKEGTNMLVGTDKEKIINESLKILSGKIKKRKILKFWDGKTSQRIINTLKEKL